MANITPITTQVPMISTPLVASPSVSAGSVSAGSASTVPVQPRMTTPQVQKASVPQEQQPTQKSVEQAINQANQMLASAGSNETISFAYEEKLSQLYVKIIDQDSGKVVREIPSKDFIRQQIALREMIGLILDKKA